MAAAMTSFWSHSTASRASSNRQLSLELSVFGCLFGCQSLFGFLLQLKPVPFLCSCSCPDDTRDPSSRYTYVHDMLAGCNSFRFTVPLAHHLYFLRPSVKPATCAWLSVGKCEQVSTYPSEGTIGRPQKPCPPHGAW